MYKNNSSSQDSHHLYACLPTFDFLSAESQPSLTPLGSADELHSVATSSTASSDTAVYPKRRQSAEHQAFAQAWKRHCDSEGSYRSAVRSVTTCDYNWERTFVLGQKSGNNEQQGIKASKSESHLHQRLRPHSPRPVQPLEEYSLGSGNPYAAPEQLPMIEPYL
jgi:hypothetical protein